MRQTPLSQLIEVKLGADLREHILTQRSQGLDWRTIADNLTASTGVEVSHESVRTWFSDEAPETTAAGAA